MAGQFVTDDEIRAALSHPVSLAYAAASLGTSLVRARSVRDAAQTAIVTTRMEEHHQIPNQICFQLEIDPDQFKQWHSTQYGDKR